MPRNRHKRHRKSPGLVRRPRRRLRPGHWLRIVLVAMAILAVPATWMAMDAYESRSRADLSVLGSGVPVVVQVHERRNAESRRLHDRVSRALRSVEPPLEWRVVEVRSEEGRRLARDYGADRLTLLLYDGRGEVVRVMRGELGEEALGAAFAAHAGAVSPQAGQ
jgi:signal transduction histidine kinase